MNCDTTLQIYEAMKSGDAVLRLSLRLMVVMLLSSMGCTTYHAEAHGSRVIRDNGVQRAHLRFGASQVVHFGFLV
ncbi:MAG: hypothetical protein WCN95_13040, partial [bacterium]